MWVSPYPWGWMPYRYGAWNFVPGYGWCWMPAMTWNSWVPVTAVNRPPVNWVPVRPPAAPPQPGAAGIVAVGRTVGPVYPPGWTHPGVSVPGSGVQLSRGSLAPLSGRVSGATAPTSTPGVIARSGAITNNLVMPAFTSGSTNAGAAGKAAPPSASMRRSMSAPHDAHVRASEHAGTSMSGGRAGGSSHGGGRR